MAEVKRTPKMGDTVIYYLNRDTFFVGMVTRVIDDDTINLVVFNDLFSENMYLRTVEHKEKRHPFGLYWDWT